MSEFRGVFMPWDFSKRNGGLNFFCYCKNMEIVVE